MFAFTFFLQTHKFLLEFPFISFFYSFYILVAIYLRPFILQQRHPHHMGGLNRAVNVITLLDSPVLDCASAHQHQQGWKSDKHVGTVT